ncbi:DotD/TraH family lipoprotein [Facilibium subflavum]|uniref:DotD/TraH family lipoprotein n=1 Tax=Facilibium subflavum TaxID=2219058 RepID=UPI000E655149|nr:DotD/TraH family lipoprotein [Facilibium subflavum]
MRRHFIKVLTVFLIIIGVLSGCSTAPKKQYPLAKKEFEIDKEVKQKLAVSSEKITDAYQLLALSDKAKYGIVHKMNTDVKSEALHQPLALQWYGPIAPLLKEITTKVGYDFQIYGKNPKFPILVAIGDVDAPKEDLAINFIANLDAQIGTQAKIFINVKQKVITLRYLNDDAG